MDKYTVTFPGLGTIDTDSGSILFIGTATTLIRLGGFTVLTDPNFLHAGDHAQLGHGLTSERLTNPAVEIEDLPPVDLCLLSHFHGDHWDHVASEKLSKELPIVTTPQAAKQIAEEGFEKTFSLDTWETFLAQLGGQWLRITALPGRHGPPIVNFALPDVMGSMLEWSWGENEPIHRLYISGDTVVYGDLEEIPQRYPEIDLGLLHLGGTRVMGVLVSMDDKQGVEMIHLVKPRDIIPIHYNDYTVFKSPLEDFLTRAAQAGLTSRIHPLEHGQTFTFEMTRREP